MVVSGATIDSLLKEGERHPPPESFRRHASWHDESVYAEAQRDPQAFWAKQAEQLHWFRRWDRVLAWDPPFAKWFAGGQLNASYNCLDRHVRSERRHKTALMWEGEPGDTRVLTYDALWREV